jgi:2-epi-valiolone-7-phosphate 1-reductase
MTDVPTLRNISVRRGDNAWLEIEERPCPPPARDHVTFRILHATICGTDRQILRGDRRDQAAILGHEAVANVEAVGADVDSFRVGERFVFNPVNPADQNEILGHSTEGVFQRFLTLSATEIKRRSLVEHAPAGLSPETCTLAEPLGTVVYTHELLSELQQTRSLLILGAGSIGTLHALYARRILGIRDVCIVCNSAGRATWLRKHGIAPDINIVHLDEKHGGALIPEVDAVVFCAPARATSDALSLAAHRLSADGCLALVGGVDRHHHEGFPGVDLIATRRRHVCGTRSGSSISETTLSGRRHHVFGHRGTAPGHLRGAFAALAAEPIMSCILTHRLSLHALPELLDSIRTNNTIAGTEYLKAVIDCNADTNTVQPIARPSTS